MRILLALLILMPAWAQQDNSQAAKPDDKTAQAPAAPKPDDKTAQTPPPADTQTPAKQDEKAATPVPSSEQWVSGNIDFGYRWVPGVGGNFQEYRSVVNLGEGPRLFGADLTFLYPKKRLFDRLDLTALDWGGDPYTTLRFMARKQRIYDLRFDYRNIAYFNAVPSFANPFAPAGFDEQSFDIRRRNLGISLDFRPGTRIIPYLAFDRNFNSGNTIQTWVQDANNQFAVPGTLRDSTNNYRGGVHFEFNRFHVTLEQGGTTYKDDDQSFWNGVNKGNVSTPVLGTTTALYGLVQAYGIRGHSIYEKALLTASPVSWIDVYGQFLFSEPQTDVHFQEVANGSFVNQALLLAYSSQQTLGTGAANQPHTTGTFGFEMRPRRRLRLTEYVMTDRYHDAASPLVTELLLAGSTPPQTQVTSLNYSQVVNYNQFETDVFYDLTSKLTVRGGYRFVWGDATVLAGTLSQTGLLAMGELHRNIALAGLYYRREKFTLHLDYEGSSSDHIYFRTSLNDYNKGRGMARYQVNSALSLQANFQILNNQNPAPDIRYDFQSRTNSLSVTWTPAGGKHISILGEYDRSTVRSNILYLGIFFAPTVSDYRENAHTATSAVDFALPSLPGAKLTVGGSLFISSGSRPSRYYQPLARLSLPIVKHVQWNTEWQYYGYGEQFYLYEGFRAHVFMTGLRVTR